MTKPFKTDSHNFKTKKLLLEAAKSIRDLPDGSRLQGDDLQLVMTVMIYYPDITKPTLLGLAGVNNVNWIEVENIGSNPFGNASSNKRLKVFTKDGRSFPFSLKKAIDGHYASEEKSKEEEGLSYKKTTKTVQSSSFLKQMKNACRSIATQETKTYFYNIFYTNSKKDATGHFVMSEVHYCDIGGEPLTETNANVDHDDPWTFNNIFNAFVESKGYDVNTLNKIQPECFKTKPGGKREFMDKNISEEFRRLHNKHAILRLLCKYHNNIR